VRTLRATLIASTSLTAVLLAGCATTSDTYDHGTPTAKYSDVRRVSKATAPAAKTRAVRKLSASAARPVPVVAKVSTVSEPPSVRIADPVIKPTVKAEAGLAFTPVARRLDDAPPAKAADVNPKSEAPSNQQAPAPLKVEAPAAAPPMKAVSAEAPKIVVTPAPPPVVPAKPEPASNAVPQARPAPLPNPPTPKAAEVKAPDVKPAEAKAPEPRAAEAKVAEVAKIPESAKAPEVKPAEAKIEVRPLSQARQAPPQPTTLPQAPAAPLPQAVPSPAQALAPVTAPAPARQAAVETAPAQAVPMTPVQRTTDGLTRAADYMASGRIVNARSLLEDQAKSGDPAILKALGETYDPLHLRDAYPKLARAGDPAKAMAAYEKAKAAGAKGLDMRIDALRAFIAAKQ
jgi:hypothetical protein